MSEVSIELRKIARARRAYESQNTPFCLNASSELLTKAADEIEFLELESKLLFERLKGNDDDLAAFNRAMAKVTSVER